MCIIYHNIIDDVHNELICCYIITPKTCFVLEILRANEVEFVQRVMSFEDTESLEC